MLVQPDASQSLRPRNSGIGQRISAKASTASVVIAVQLNSGGRGTDFQRPTTAGREQQGANRGGAGRNNVLAFERIPGSGVGVVRHSYQPSSASGNAYF